MSFKDRKRDDHGHVIGNDEVDGQKCKHQPGGSNKPENKKGYDGTNKTVNSEDFRKAKEMPANEALKYLKSKGYTDAQIGYSFPNSKFDQYMKGNLDYDPFDDDYDAEFDEYNREMKKAADENFDMSEGEDEFDKFRPGDRLNSKDGKSSIIVRDKKDDGTYNVTLIQNGQKQDGIASAEDLNRWVGQKELTLEDAINMADDDILDEEFGKDTPERKLVGAMKGHFTDSKEFDTDLEKAFPYISDNEKEKIKDAIKNHTNIRSVGREVTTTRKLLQKYNIPFKEQNGHEGGKIFYINKKTDEDQANIGDLGKPEDFAKKTKMASGTLYEYPNGERKMVSDEENAFNQGRTVPADEKGSGWNKTKMASGILYEGPNGEREMVDDNENEMKSRYQKIRDVLGDNADETIEWLFNHLSKLNDYKK